MEDTEQGELDDHALILLLTRHYVRLPEVTRFAEELHYDGPVDLLLEIASSLAAISTRKVDDCGNCLDIGGCSVKDWVRYQLLTRSIHFEVSKYKPDEEERFVTCIHHFWPWDIERYGPPPLAESSRAASELRKSLTQRSPITRLMDGKPINRVTHRVASTKKSRPKKKQGTSKSSSE